MVVNAEAKRSPAAAAVAAGNGEKGKESMFSPRFRSVAEMAGWDEETLLIASLVVEDTPDRQIKNKRRTNLHFKTPPTNSRSKRRAQRRGPAPIPVAVLNLDQRRNQGVEGAYDRLPPAASACPCRSAACPCRVLYSHLFIYLSKYSNEKVWSYSELNLFTNIPVESVDCDCF